MANIDKNQAIVDYLLQCPSIRDNPVFFNFINAKDNNKQIVTVVNDKIVDKPYIDGSVLKRFTFTIIDYKSIAYNAIVKEAGYSNENIEEMLDTQSIIDWITEQELIRNYPDFGDNLVIESIKALSDNPNLNGVDTGITPALAKYSISVQIDYIDYSHVMWT